MEDRASPPLLTQLQLPSLPAVYDRILEITADPNASHTEIARIMEMDSAVSLRLLRLANSAFYGFPRKVESVDEALAIIGINPARELLLFSCAIEVFSGISPEYVNMSSLWQHSCFTGLLAKELALARREIRPERFFLAGMFHDLGQVLLFQHDPASAQKRMQRSMREGIALWQLEARELGFDHAQLAGRLLGEWGLPEDLVVLVKWHHEPGHASPYESEVSVLHTADFCAMAVGPGNSGEILTGPIRETAFDLSGVDPENLPELIGNTHRQMAETMEIFGISNRY